MTATSAQRSLPRINPLLLAVLISLAIHGSGVGVWKLGNKYGWWQKNQISAWLQRIENKVLPAPPLMEIGHNASTEEPPLMFIEVNPELAVAQAPKDVKFQAAVNTIEASPNKSDAPMPKIAGQQKEALKITEDAPPKAVTVPDNQKIAPPEKDETEAKSLKAKPEGDLAFAKPDEKDEAQKEKPDVDKGKEEETRRRPRTLFDALKKRPGTPGPKYEQEGGSKLLDVNSSLDVKGTSFGDYLGELSEAVKQRWFEQLRQVDATKPGKVVIQFRLHADGRVSNTGIGSEDVGELLSLICQKAIQDPSPYKKWPRDLRREMKTDYIDLSFTFHYLRK